MNFITLHLVALIITAPVVLYADHMGFKYLTGRTPTISAKKLAWTHHLVTIGLILLIVSGIIITVPLWAIMFEKPLFYAKLAFVCTLATNGFFIGKLMKKASVIPFADLSVEEKRLLFVSGMVSACSWGTTILIGFFGL
ncbi:MAG: hypothetical protein WA060_03605 [Minisyncoccia bacterium]